GRQLAGPAHLHEIEGECAGGRAARERTVRLLVRVPDDDHDLIRPTPLQGEGVKAAKKVVRSPVAGDQYGDSQVISSGIDVASWRGGCICRARRINIPR